MKSDTIRETAKKLIRDQRGATMAEYLIIVGLVALACFGAYDLFGDAIKAKVDQQTGKIQGIE